MEEEVSGTVLEYLLSKAKVSMIKWWSVVTKWMGDCYKKLHASFVPALFPELNSVLQ